MSPSACSLSSCAQLCCTACPWTRSKSNPKHPGLTCGGGRVPARVRDSKCLDLVCEQASEGMTKCLKVWTFGEESLGSLFLGYSSASCGAMEMIIFFSPFFSPFQKSRKYIDMSWVRKQKPLKNFGKSRHVKNVLSETFQSYKNQNISLHLQLL